MSALLRGEMLKVRTTRTAIGFALATLALVLLQVLISILTADLQSVEDKRQAIAVGGTAGIILLIFGIVGATGEFRHRTVAPAVLIAPDRLRLAIARTLAYAGTGLLVGVCAIALALVLGVPLLGDEPGPELTGDDYLSVIVGGLCTATLSAALGVGVGLIVRNQVAGVVGMLVWLFVIEPLFSLVDEDAVDYMIGTSSASAAGGPTENALTWGPGLAALAVWTVVLVAAGVLVDRRRDVD